MSNTLPLDRAFLRANPPEQSAALARKSPELATCRSMVIDWHRRYAGAASAVADVLGTQGVSGLRAEQEADDIAESKAFFVLSNTGHPDLQVLAMRVLDPEGTFRGSARLFLRNAELQAVREWAREVAAWETRWADTLAAPEVGPS